MSIVCGPNSPTSGLNLFTNPLYGPGGYDTEDIAQDLIRERLIMPHSGVRRDGEHHNDNASNAIGDFLGDRGCIPSLRLHPHAQPNEEATKGNLAASSAGRTSARLFRSRR